MNEIKWEISCLKDEVIVMKQELIDIENIMKTNTQILNNIYNLMEKKWKK